MIVYHLTEDAEVAEALQEGLKRAAGRSYVFDDWAVVDRLLRGLAEERGTSTVFEQTRVLLLEVDGDVLVRRCHPFSSPASPLPTWPSSSSNPISSRRTSAPSGRSAFAMPSEPDPGTDEH